MKNIIIAIPFILNLAYSQADTLDFLDYFPAEIGNKWWYQETVTDLFDTVQHKYSRYIEVVGDTVMPNGHPYRHFKGYRIAGSGFFRIDTLSRKVYELIDYGDTSFCPEREVLRYDLSSMLAFDSLNWCNGYSNCETEIDNDFVCRSEGESNIGIGDTTIPYLHFFWHYGFDFRMTLSKGIGITEFWWWEIGGGLGNLTAAEINGIYYEVQLEVAGAADPSPGSYNLSPPYPNPFNPVTTVAYELPETAPVTLDIYDILGRKVITLVDNRLQARGYYQVTWDGRDGQGLPLPSGIYIARLLVPPKAGMTPNYTSYVKMVLLK